MGVHPGRQNGFRARRGTVAPSARRRPTRYRLARDSPCFIPKKNATAEKTIIDGRTIMNTVEGVIIEVSPTVATATMATSGATDRGKSYSIAAVVVEST
jgi:hypothetical protein